MKRIISLAVAAALIMTFAMTAFAAGFENFTKVNTYTQGYFTDVEESAWYADNVAAAYEMGLVNGVGNNMFDPNGNVSIAQALALACRLNSIYHTGTQDFIQGEVWYQVYVDYAIEKEIIRRDDFAGNYVQNATRLQFAMILGKALPEDAFAEINNIEEIPDVAVDSIGASQVYKLYKAGVLTGNDEYGTFNPDGTIKRSAVSAIVSRMADPSLRQKFVITKDVLSPEEEALLVILAAQPVADEINAGAEGVVKANKSFSSAVKRNFDAAAEGLAALSEATKAFDRAAALCDGIDSLSSVRGKITEMADTLRPFENYKITKSSLAEFMEIYTPAAKKVQALCKEAYSMLGEIVTEAEEISGLNIKDI